MPASMLASFHEQWSLQRIALNGAVRFAINHCLEHTFDTIDGDDRDILAWFQASFLNSLNCTKGHIIIMCEEDIDFRTIGFEEGLHDFLTFLASEFTSLGSEDIVLAGIRGGCERILEAFLTADCNGGANRALEHYDIKLAAAITRGLILFRHVLINPFEYVLAFGHRIRADLGNIQGIITDFHITVYDNNRNLGIFGFLQDRIPAGFNNRNEGDDINTLCNKRTDGLDLVLLLLLSI